MPRLSFSQISKLKTSDFLTKLETSFEGISEEKASLLLAKYGKNVITGSETTAFDILKRQFKSPFVFLLFGAGLLSFLLGERIDAFMIALFVFINASLGFYQEYRSNQTVKLLKKYLASKIRTLRGGIEVNLETSLLVPGDVVLLEPGDIIPADIRFTEVSNLTVNETVLTGESVPVTKTSLPLKSGAKDIYWAQNIGFSGTVIASGTARGVVFATGKDTNYGEVVKLASETVKESSFENEIGKFSKFTLWIVLATLLFVIITSIAVKEDPSLTELIIFSIALAVSVIPEALPVVTTFSLSIGAYNLARRSVVVKRLTSVEDLGALEVLCSDKTGTLTENKLKVDDYLSGDKDQLLLFACLASYFSDTSRNAGNNAFDVALLSELNTAQKGQITKFKNIGQIPFDPERRRVTALVQFENKKFLVSRGSPEVILSLCKELKGRANIVDWVVQKGLRGKRSLGVAIREIKDEKVDNLLDLETKMEFLGAVSFEDPIKPSSFTAISKAKSLGVVVKIITGDSPEVAGDVAFKIGLTPDPKEVITGSDFGALGTTEKHEAVSRFNVFARISPAQKHEIITLLKEKYYVGFLGEGINDAPALKASNVSIVVESGSDVAKEASDIVLLKKDLEVIIDGIGEGRRVFANTSKYITATMASNFGNFFAVALIAPFIPFLPMLPLQLLLVNLLSDFPMIMVATDSVDDELVSTPKKYNLKSFATSALAFGFISTAFDFVLFSTFVGRGAGQLQTYWFIESILSELLFLFSIRSEKPFYMAKLPSKSILYLTLATITLTIAIPFTTFGRDLFGFVTPQFSSLMIVFGIVAFYLLSNEVAKAVLRRYQVR